MAIFARVLLFLVVCIVVPGSANAQRSLDGVRRAWAECQAKQNTSPEFLALRHKIGSRASPEMASSTDKATPEEARQLLILLRDYMMPCRQFELELARRRLPPIVPSMEAAYAKSDVNFERLTTGQIAWGQFIRDGKAIRAELEDELRRHESAAEDESPSDSSRR
jgi:hypothetical protein